MLINFTQTENDKLYPDYNTHTHMKVRSTILTMYKKTGWFINHI